MEKRVFNCSDVVIVSEHNDGTGRYAAKWCCVIRFLVTEGVPSFEISQLSAVIDNGFYVTIQF